MACPGDRAARADSVWILCVFAVTLDCGGDSIQPSSPQPSQLTLHTDIDSLQNNQNMNEEKYKQKSNKITQ